MQEHYIQKEGGKRDHPSAWPDTSRKSCPLKKLARAHNAHPKGFVVLNVTSTGKFHTHKSSCLIAVCVAPSSNPCARAHVRVSSSEQTADKKPTLL
jgi:hypothetical protein